MRTTTSALLLLAAAAAGACENITDPALRASRQVAAGGAGAPALAPVLASVGADTLRPGAIISIAGENFDAAPAGDVVTVAGVVVRVVAASPRQLQVQLPGASSFPCLPTQSVPVQVTTAAGSAWLSRPLAVASRRELQPGQSVVLTDAGASSCNELGVTGGKYLVTVFADGTSPAALTRFRLRGSVGGSSGAAAGSAGAAASTAAVGVPSRQPPQASARPHVAGGHDELLWQDHDLMARLGAPRWPRAGTRERAGAGGAGATGATSSPLPRVGDTLSLKVPQRADVCDSAVLVRARVVAVGARAVVVEDLAAPAAGAADSVYAALAEEFDQVQYPLLRANFGELFRLDPRGWGREIVLFTPRVNADSLSGYVTSADLYPADRCRSSNQALVVYAATPASAADVRGGWGHFAGSVLVHESKHLVSAVERLSRSAPPEEPWLEEATATIAQEIWARHAFGNAQLSNAGYAQTLRCEVLGTRAPGCAGRPRALLDRMRDFYVYLAGVEGYTPLGRVSPGDYSFYASGWWLLRWASDLLGAGDAAFFTALTQDASHTGVANLEAHTGRSFKALLAQFALALALDDRPGFTPDDPALRFPSWNLPDLLAGLHRDWPSAFPSASPLPQHAAAFGDFTAEVAGIRAGSAAYFLLSGKQPGRQLLELSGSGGAAVPANLGIAIVRLE